MLAPRAAQTSTYCRTESEGTLHSHRRGEVRHSWRSRPGARAACHARLAWWNGAVAGCSEPRSGRAARACVCVECPAGLLHSLLAGCAADLVGWRGVCAAAAARGVPPRAPRAVELRRAGRGALW